MTTTKGRKPDDNGAKKMKTTRHFSRTDAINEAKRVYGVAFKDFVKLEHDGAFWVLSEKGA